MADVFGRAFTYGSVSADHNELLQAIYDYFISDADPNWQIKAGVTTTGKTLVLEDKATQTLNVVLGDHSEVGGTMIGGSSSLSSSYDMVVAMDPGGGVTDTTIAGFTVGSRFSGWCRNAEGPSYGSHSGRAKVSSGADWIFIRFKNSSTGAYDGGFFAGAYNRLDAGIGSGFCLFAGSTWSDIAQISESFYCGFEARDGDWDQAGVYPANSLYGPTGAARDDGTGVFRTAPVCLMASGYSGGAVSSTVSYFWGLGTIPGLMCAGIGSIGRLWRDSGSNPIGYNMSGGSWIALDDGTDAE